MHSQDLDLEILTPVQKAFGKQSSYYDEADSSNQILVDWRRQVYAHINSFLKPGRNILELNSGTGIDALHLVQLGHSVLATDVAPGMIGEIQKKIKISGHPDRFMVRQLSFEELNTIEYKQFDYLFSNFGGLNCIPDLKRVATHLPALLKDGAFVTWVIMPPVCLWEWLTVLKGNRRAFRRLNHTGVTAHVAGEHFKTYYHSLSQIKESLGPSFQLLKVQGLGALSPPPSSLKLTLKHPFLYSCLKKLDQWLATGFPFNRWADHIVVTFKFRKP